MRRGRRRRGGDGSKRGVGCQCLGILRWYSLEFLSQGSANAREHSHFGKGCGWRGGVC
jgi:hypothetical protein